MIYRNPISRFFRAKRDFSHKFEGKFVSVGSRIIINRAVPNVFQSISTSKGLGTWLAKKISVDYKIGGAVNMIWDDPVTEKSERFEGSVLNLVEDEAFSVGVKDANSFVRILEFSVDFDKDGTLLIVHDKYLPCHFKDAPPTIACVNWHRALLRLNESLYI